MRLKQKQQVTSVVAVVIITLPFQSAIGLNSEPLRIPWAYKMMAERHFDMTQTVALTAGQCSPLYHFLYREGFWVREIQLILGAGSQIPCFVQQPAL